MKMVFPRSGRTGWIGLPLTMFLVILFLFLSILPAPAADGNFPEPWGPEKLLDSIYRSAPIGIGIVIDRVFVDVNTYILDLTGYTREELIGQSARILYLSDEDSAYVGTEKYRQIAEKGHGTVETLWVRKDGSIRDILLSSVPIDPRDLSAGVTFTALDITQRKRDEETLKAAFNTANIGIGLADHTGRYMMLNSWWSDYLGYSMEELLTKTNLDITHPPDIEESREVFERVLRGEIDTYRLEKRFERKDGKIVWGDLSASPIRDHNGNVLLMIGMVSDITSRKAAEARLRSRTAWFTAVLVFLIIIQLFIIIRLIIAIRERRKALKALREKSEELDRYFTSSLDLLCIADTDGFFRRMNPEWERTLGYSLKDLENRRFFDLVHPEDQEATLSAIQTLEKQESIFSFENRYLCADGTYRWIEWRSQPIGKLIYAAARDITSRKKSEEQLRSALREKTVLLREVHHRVKNNLGVITSLLNLQSENVKTPEEAIRALKNSLDRVLAMALVHQELYESEDYSQIDMENYIGQLTEKIKYSYCLDEKVEINTEVERLFFSVDHAIPCGLILNELITNSIKYAFPAAESGIISVALRRLDGGYAELSVSDTGVGLPEETESKGTLGLTLVRVLSEQLEGELEITPQAYPGAGFRVLFPVKSR